MSLIKKSNELIISPILKMMVYGQAGMGKAQPLFSNIITPTGYKPMGNIKVGDEVLSANGSIQRVIGIFPQGLRPYYKVTTNDGCQCFCDIDHIWSVRNSTGNSRKAGWRNMTLRSMIEKGIICPLSPSAKRRNRRPSPRFEIPVAKPCKFDSVELPIDPYVLGVLIGDGYLVGSTVAFSNPDPDNEIKLKVEKRIPAGYRLKKHDGACPQYLIIQIKEGGKHGFKKEVSNLGLDVHSGDKFIPNQYLISSVEQRLELLKGLMDTDGYCINNRTLFSTTSLKLAQDMVTLVRSLGGIATINYYTREDRDAEEYRVRIRMDICPFSLHRKASEWSPIEPSRYIVSAEYMGETMCQCIKVSGEEELYITDDFMVTHNTTFALSAPKPLLLDFDNGVKRVNLQHLDGVDIVQITSWNDVKQLVNEDLSAYQSIVPDTVGKMMDFIISYKCGSRQPQVQDWNGINAEFSWFVREFSKLGKNLIFIAHRDSRKEGDKNVFIPYLREKNYNAIVTELDLLGYLEMKSEQGVQRRTITFDPTDRNDGKNTCNLPSVMNIPTVVDAAGNAYGQNNFIAEKIIKPYLGMLNHKIEEIKKYSDLIEEISEQIELITDAQSANDFASRINSFEHVGSSLMKTRALFSAKVKALKLVYDKETKTYSDATAA